MSDERIRVELDLPRNLLEALDVREDQLVDELKLRLALALVREQTISSGKAAEILGRSKTEFVDIMDRHGIPYFTESPEVIQAQVAAMRDVLDRDK